MFKTLSTLLEDHRLKEAADDTEGDIPDDSASDMGGGIGSNPHPVLSRAELVRFADKIDQAHGKIEEVRSIFKSAEGATGPAHKLHHIGSKGNMDMSHFQEVNDMLDKLEQAVDDLHQSWGTQIQQDTGALDEPGAEDHEADTDDLNADDDTTSDATPPTDDEEPTETPPDDKVKEGMKDAVARTAAVAGALYTTTGNAKMAAGAMAGSAAYHGVKTLGAKFLAKKAEKNKTK